MAAALVTLAVGGCAAARIAPLRCHDRLAAWASGPEDVVVEGGGAAGPRLIVSVQERRVRNRDGSFHYQGQILAVPLTGPRRGEARPFTIQREPGRAFHPHGIYLLPTAQHHLLYVVNHENAERHPIEVFVVDGDTLRADPAHPSLPSTDLLPNPNDLVALPSGDVYVTNLTRRRSRIGQLLEAALRGRSGSVVHYRPDAPEGERWRVVATDLAFPNGIEVTSAGDRVLVAATGDSRLHLFGRDGGSGALHLVDRIEVGTGVDNLAWEEADRTLIAARHPDLLAFLRHAARPEARSPSELLRVDVVARTVDVVYADAGHEVSGASVGVPSAGRLYIGQVFGQGVLDCEMRPP